MCTPMDRQTGDLRQGEHFCLVYESAAEQTATAVSFITHGLAGGERCTLIADGHTAQAVADALAAGGLDVDAEQRRGALVPFSARDCYLRQGRFEPEQMIEFLREAEAASLGDGFTGLRVMGEMTWALSPDPGGERLVEYEALLNEFLCSSKARMICQYDRRRFTAAVIRDVLRTHPAVVLGGRAGQNPYYAPPELVLGPASAERQVDWMIGQLAQARAAEQTLHELNERLADADRRKDEFLAVLAHELRNPLAPLRNALHILRLANDDGVAREQARSLAERQVQHLGRLVDDLLDVSRIARGKVRLHKEPVELAAAVSGAVAAVTPLVDARRHDLSVSLPTEAVRLEADPTRLEQVLVNLLTNAAKYTEPGGRIWLTAERDGGEAVVRIRDTGIGIAADVLCRVFEPFVQAERSLDRSQGGLGLGLALVRSLVELHGGSVSTQSAGADQGSEFLVRLPALPQARAERPATVFKGRGAGGGRALRVLVVDDNLDAAESLAVLLNLWGHEARLAHDGRSALEVVAAYRPHVALLDIGLPGMDGYAVARRVRQDMGPDAPLLIALTGYAQEEDRRRAREAGFDEHLVKPVDPEALEALLARSEWVAQQGPEARADRDDEVAA